MLKSSETTCFQNIIKGFLYFDLFPYVYNSNTVMKKKKIYPCCENCSKVYSSISSRRKRGKKKEQWSENNIDPDISLNEETKWFHFETTGCATTGNYKYNIGKHLKSCYSVNNN